MMDAMNNIEKQTSRRPRVLPKLLWPVSIFPLTIYEKAHQHIHKPVRLKRGLE